MRIETMMKKEVFTLRPDDTLAAAIQLQEKHNIRHIPIVDQAGQLIGMVSDRDIRSASPPLLRAHEHAEEFNLPLHKIMTTKVITGHPLDFVEEVSAVLYSHRISCLPIISGGKLVGIVTDTDLLHTLVQLTGATQPGSRIEVKVPNKAGKLADIAALCKQMNMNISSVLVYPDQDMDDKVLVFRVATMNPGRFITELSNAGYEVLWPDITR